MNQKTTTILTAIVLTFFSCNAKSDTSLDITEMERADRHADHVTMMFTKKMHEELGLLAIGTGGGGSPREGLNHLSVTFECYDKMNIDQARQLLIKCTNEFLQEINENKDITTCLTTVPFTDKNIKLSILFINHIFLQEDTLES